MPDYSFDPRLHIYYMDGKPVPSVTGVLPNRGYINCDYQRTRGSYAHEAIKLYLKNDLDEADLDPVLVPYLNAFKKAESANFQGVLDLKTGSKTPTVELQLAGYTLLANEGVKADGTRPDIIEIEEPLFHPGLRFGGTPDMIITNDYPVIKVAALYLGADGRPKFDDLSKNLRRNRELFRAFVSTYHWSSQNGFLKRR